MEDTNKQEPSWGEKQAGVSFNPGGDPTVNDVKADFGKLFDKLNDLRADTDNGDKKRFYSMAITNLNDSQMEAVKAITWRW